MRLVGRHVDVPQAAPPCALREAGADPAIMAGWMAEVQAERALAEARLREAGSAAGLSGEEIARIVTALGDRPLPSPAD